MLPLGCMLAGRPDGEVIQNSEGRDSNMGCRCPGNTLVTVQIPVLYNLKLLYLIHSKDNDSFLRFVVVNFLKEYLFYFGRQS